MEKHLDGRWSMVITQKDKMCQKGKEEMNYCAADPNNIYRECHESEEEVLGEFHKKVNPEESQVKIRSIQQTKLGEILFEIGGENFGLLRYSKESH